jgi:hypothetical protein
MAEDAVQAMVRLRASQLGWRLFRNNVGVLLDETGRPVRFGLANDSKQLNAEYKSGDLIGIRPVLILPEHVGRTLGVFASVECKHPNWVPRASDTRYQAQKRWADLITSLGGYAHIVTGPEQLL